MKRLILLLISVLALGATACSPTDPTDPYAAVVNGEEISSKTITDELQLTVNNSRYAACWMNNLGAARVLVACSQPETTPSARSTQRLCSTTAFWSRLSIKK